MNGTERSTPTANTLRRHGIVPTAQRLAIARVVLSKPQHLSAEQVFSLVTQQGNTAHVSKATVYNTLSLFVGKGLIQEVIADPSRIFYCSTTVPHPHFYNVDTHELEDADPALCRVQLEQPLPEGTELESVDVVIRVRNIPCH
ncbi:MAG TPA: transcriptional repressor [Chromatiales bacterium]|nr:transcriptional repressor [Chromatiales bacterium]